MRAHAWPNVLAVNPEGDLAPDRTLGGDEDYSEPLSITNSFGVPSFDPEFWQTDMADAVAHARRGQVVVGSFQGTLPDMETWRTTSRTLRWGRGC